MMRLLLAGDIRPVHLRRYAEYFKERGHDVAVASAENSSDYTPDYDIRVFSAPDVIKYPTGIFSFRKALNDFKPDILNCHFVPNYGLLGAMSGFHPLAISIWGSDILVSARKTRFHKSRARKIMQRADLLLADAEMLSDAARKIIGHSIKILTVPFGVKRELLDLGCRKEIKDAERLKLVSTRQMVGVTRVGDFVEALNLLKGHIDFEASLFGDGPEYDIIKRKVDSFDLDNVSMHGALPHDELLNKLLEYDIYVSCSRSDSTSVSLLEAMASGLFPIVSDIAGNREWISHEENGLLFTVGDSSRLNEMIKRAVNDFDLRKRAIQMNFDIILKKAVWEDNMALVEKEFEALAAKK
ncbi:MAG: glycosyltransferase [candidate division Zixibacteria bacterium]|nr:glycosyltransferase [candidate division Zixibacteria bacterium]